MRIGELIEESRRHLRAAGIVNAGKNDFEHEVSGYFFPMLSNSLLSAIESGWRAEAKERLMRRSSMENACYIRAVDFFRRSLDGGWIGHAPVRRHWLSRPDGTDFIRRVVADRKDEVKLRRVRFGELIPGFAAKTCGAQIRRLDLLKCLRANDTRWMASGAVGGEVRTAFPIHDRFGHDRAGRVAGAEKQDVVVWPSCSPTRSTMARNKEQTLWSLA